MSEKKLRLQLSPGNMQDLSLSEGPIRRLAAGDKNLAAGNPPEDKVLALFVQLREHVV